MTGTSSRQHHCERACGSVVALSWDAPGRARLTLGGEIDLAAHERLRDVLDNAARCAADIRVDAAELRFCDAGAIGLLVHADSRLRAHGRRLHITHATGRIRRILHLAEADRLLEPDAAFSRVGKAGTRFPAPARG